MSRTNQTDDPSVPEDLATVIATADPIPFDLLQSLRSSLGRRSVGADVAELVYDSVVDEPRRVRGLHASRQLSFQGPKVSVEMEVMDERQRVFGQLVPPAPGEVEVRHRSGTDVVVVDDVGRFVVDALPRGPVSFRCRADDGGAPVVTVTDWVIL